jgi:TolB-like protein
MNRTVVAQSKAARVVVLALALLGLLSGGAAAQVSVAILPFDVNAQESLDYLREGLSDMLASRLGGSEGIEVLGRERVRAALGDTEHLSAEKARAVGAALGASHVLYGSLTVIGNGLSLDARLLEVSGEEAKSFYAEGQGLEMLIPKVTELSSQVSAALLGQPAAPAPAATSPPPAAPPQAAQAAATAVPPAPLVQEVAQAVPPEQPVPPAGAAGGEAFIKINDETGAWRSRSLSFDVRGVDVADIDGDGRLEIVFLDQQHVYVYRLEQATLVEAERWEAPRAADCLAVDAADLNGNGKAEIYVSAIMNKKLASFVLELSGAKLEKLADGLDHYLRVIDYPGAGEILVGQQMGRDAAFRPGIYRMRWNGGKLEQGDTLTSRAEFTVYNVLPVEREGSVAYLAILSDDLLHLYSGSEERWRSQDYYAGSRLYVEIYSPNVSNEEALRSYLPQRILAVEGGQLVAAVANKGVLSRWLKSYKNYTGGELRLLAWNPQGLSQAWVSRPIDAYIADIAAGDIDGDGTQELLAAVSMKTSWNPLHRTRSGLVVYRLPAR